MAMGWYRISKLWFGNRHSPPVCGQYLKRMSSRFGHPTVINGGELHNLRQTPNSPVVSVKQLDTNTCGKAFDQILSDINVVVFGRRYHHNVYHKIRNLVVVGVASLGSAYLIGHREDIPYSKRSHLVLVPRWAERMVGDLRIEEVKKDYEGEILAPTHPITTKLTLIAEKVFEALETGLRDSNNWPVSRPWMEAFRAFWQGNEFIHPNPQTRGAQHLNHLNRFQVLVLDDPDTINAFCFSNGTIVVHSGILDLLDSDDEMAVIIGHEVAHGVARHYSAMVTHSLCLFDFLGLFFDNFAIPAMCEKFSNALKNRSLSVKHELEADYIGMLLMASAGYDPRAALAVYRKLGEAVDDLEENDDLRITNPSPYFMLPSTHPSGKRRVECLTQALEEAMALYREGTSKTTSTDHSFKPECTI